MVQGKNSLDFLKFRDVLRMMQEGAHLTPDGIAKIRVIASRMNRGQGR